MQEDKIGEIRGVNTRQELEPELVETAKEKYKDLPGAQKYEKADHDMKEMTKLHQKSFSIDKETKEKTYLNPELSKEDLTFLYELNSSIEGFGYDKDPRIEEIRTKRNIQEDTLIIFECTKNQIATSKVEIDENTKAYIGPWNIDVYNTIKKYSSIIHLYESFPDKNIFTYELQTDQSIQTPEQAQQKLEEKNMYISDYGKDLLHKTEFSKEQNTYKLVQFTVEQLGFKESATTDQVYTKAQELGLKLCPAEVGPLLRLAYAGEDWKLIAMKQITDRDGFPRVFYLNSDDAELRLNGYYSQSDDRWSSDSQFVFLAH